MLLLSYTAWQNTSKIYSIHINLYVFLLYADAGIDITCRNANCFKYYVESNAMHSFNISMYKVCQMYNNEL